MRVPRAVRLGVLLALLAGVLLFAWHDVSRRRERNEWKRTLDVALIIVKDGRVDERALAGLRARVPELARRLRSELARYRPGAPAPFAFTTFGPANLGAELPGQPAEGLWGAVKHAHALHRFTRASDDTLAVPSRGFDARIYVVVRPATDQALVEGFSEHGGRIGIAFVELDPDTVDTALFVAAHELFHTLGATDRYGPDGRALVPDGLAEPHRVPLYPQQKAEVMARARPLSPNEEARPEVLDELAVGEVTAREIGWRTPESVR